MKDKFVFVRINGMEEEIIEADSIKVYLKGNERHYIELSPRNSDEEISIYSGGVLSITPMAANCVRVESKDR